MLKRTLVGLALLMLAQPARAACTDPCLQTYLDLKTGALFLAETKPAHTRRYIWNGWEQYRQDAKRQR